MTWIRIEQGPSQEALNTALSSHQAIKIFLSLELPSPPPILSSHSLMEAKEKKNLKRKRPEGPKEVRLSEICGSESPNTYE